MDYRTIYPSGSSPAKLYGTAKVHKFTSNDVDELPLRPIISRVSTTIRYKKCTYTLQAHLI